MDEIRDIIRRDHWLKLLIVVQRAGLIMFAIGWCLAVMDGVKPKCPQPELGRIYEFWSAGPRYLTRGEYLTRYALMGGGFVIGAVGTFAGYTRVQSQLRR